MSSEVGAMHLTSTFPIYPEDIAYVVKHFCRFAVLCF